MASLRISPTVTVLIGCVMVLGSLLSYQVAIGELRIADSQNIRFLGPVAYSTVGLLFAGLMLAFLGLSRSLPGRSQSKMTASNLPPSLLASMSAIFRERRSSRVFTVSAVAYGVLFTIVSGTLVYQPSANFSTLYGISVPSAVPVVCCGTLGQMPQLVFYLTHGLAIILVPLNLILLFIVSWLVGLNAAIVRFAYSRRPLTASVRWSGGIGAIVGLFTVCPACAGFFLLGVIGLTGGIGPALPVSSLQAIFVAVGIVILLVAPIFGVQRLNRIQACNVRHEPS